MRLRVEALAGAVALIALLFLGVQALRPVRIPGIERAEAGSLGQRLRDWVARPRAESLAVVMSAPVDPPTRDWLRALHDAGTDVGWSGRVPSVALESDWEPGPSGAALMRVAGPDGERFVVGDGLGPVDSASIEGAGGTFRVPAARADLWASVGNLVLRRRPSREVARRVVVLARADWESRFVVAALESGGWATDVRLHVGPDLWVTQGRALPLDTARQGVVIVLGTPDAAGRRAVQDFVRSGGGLVLAGGVSGFEALAPGGMGPLERPVAGIGVPASRDQLEYRPIVRLARGAGALDASAGGIRTAVRRSGPGRVLLIGDTETWRLALGSDEGRAEHAALWNRAVALASPRSPARPGAGDDVAPRAALVAALGPAREPAPPLLVPDIPWEQVAGAVLFAVLIAEWAGRRMRGVA